jgi:hypothetical protein
MQIWQFCSCDTLVDDLKRVIGPVPGFCSSGRQGFFGVVFKARINSGLTHPAQLSALAV